MATKKMSFPKSDTYLCNNSGPTFPPDLGFTKAIKTGSAIVFLCTKIRIKGRIKIVMYDKGDVTDD